MALVLAACGSSSKKSGSSSSSSSQSGGGGGDFTAPVVKGKKGGHLTSLFAGEIDYIDPGATYYSGAFPMFQAIVRPLYGYLPDKNDITPDVAAGMPTVSKDNKTVTVKIKPNIKFGPPVNRVVTSKDVAYAISRSFLPKLTNGYVGTYYSNVIGFKNAKAGQIVSGLQTPNKTTLVIKLSKPEAVTVANALVLPNSAPVPMEYAVKYDKQSDPAAYGLHQIATGPYMIANNSSGKLTGYQASKKIELVRNPNWDPKTDFRPAYVDRITIKENNTDTSQAVRAIETGKSLIHSDFDPDAQDLKTAVQRYKSQTAAAPPGGTRWISLNTTIKPLDNINVRKAIVAATDRDALRLTRGGPIVGDIAQGYIPPGFKGYEESGGSKGFSGPAFDFMQHPTGDLALAQQYLKKAGYKSGKITGVAPLLMVADNSDPGKSTAVTFQQQMTKIGLPIKPRFVEHAAMYTKFCGVPKAKVAICPNTGWFKDFYETGAMLNPVFNGKNIIPSGNVNWPQLNDPKINALLDKTNALADEGQRTKGWAEANKEIVAQAVTVPWVWDKEFFVESKNVQGVINNYNATWDLSYTSLK